MLRALCRQLEFLNSPRSYFCLFPLKYDFITILKKICQMAEWLALQTGKRGYPSSIPAEVKSFFGGIKILERYIACRFELNFNLTLIKIVFN